MYGYLDYFSKGDSDRNLSYFWLLFIVPIIMIGVGAVFGSLL
jgi:hypothetical protein